MAWVGAGLRLLDVSDPTRARQIGSYVPAEPPPTWSAYWISGTDYIYALDLNRGRRQVTARPGGPEVGALDHGTRVGSVSELAAASLCAGRSGNRR